MSDWKGQLTGIFPPIMTPFASDNGPVLHDKLTENIHRYNTTGLRGYMPLGSNGEFRSLTDEESINVLKTVMKAKDASKVVIAGAGRESAYTAIEFIKMAADTGVDFASLLPPHYFKGSMQSDALIRFYTAVADASPVPIMLYNIPKFASDLLISSEVVNEMAPHPNVAGMKDSSKEDISLYVRAVPESADFHILSGSVNKYYGAMMNGCVGGVLSMANYLPEMACALHELAMRGRSKEGDQLDENVRTLSANAAGNYGPAGVKAAMDLLGYYGGPPRNPLPACTPDEKASIQAVLQKAGKL